MTEGKKCEEYMRKSNIYLIGVSKEIEENGK